MKHQHDAAGPRLSRARHDLELSRRTLLNARSDRSSAGEHPQPRNPDARLSPGRSSLIFWTCVESNLRRKYSRDGCSGSHWDAATGPLEMHLSDNAIIHALILQGVRNKYSARTVAPLLCFRPPGWGAGACSVQYRSALFRCR